MSDAAHFHAASAVVQSSALAHRREQAVIPLALPLPPPPSRSSPPSPPLTASMLGYAQSFRPSVVATATPTSPANHDDSDGYITDIYDPRAMATFSSHYSSGLSYFSPQASTSPHTVASPLLGSAATLARTHDTVSGAAAQLSASQRFKFRRHKQISPTLSVSHNAAAAAAAKEKKAAGAKAASASRTFSSALAFWRDRSTSTPTPSASECSSSVDASDFTPTPTPPQLNVSLGPEALAAVAARASCTTPEAFDEGTLKSAATRDKMAVQGLGLSLRDGAKDRVLDAHYGMEQQWATSSAADVLVPVDVSTRKTDEDQGDASKPAKFHRSRHSEGSLLALTLSSQCMSNSAAMSASLPTSPSRPSNEGEPSVALSLIEAVCLPPQLKHVTSTAMVPTDSAASSTPSQQMTPVATAFAAHTFTRPQRGDSVSTTRAPSIDVKLHGAVVPLSNRVARLRARPATAGDVFSSSSAASQKQKQGSTTSLLPRPKSAGTTGSSSGKKGGEMLPPAQGSVRKVARANTPTRADSPGRAGSTRSRFRRLASRDSSLRGGAENFSPGMPPSSTFSSFSYKQQQTEEKQQVQQGRVSPHPRRMTSWTSKLRAAHPTTSNAVSSVAAWRLASTSAVAPHASSSDLAGSGGGGGGGLETSSRPSSYSFVDSLALGSMTCAPAPSSIAAATEPDSFSLPRSKTESSLTSLPAFSAFDYGALHSPRIRGRTDSRPRVLHGQGGGGTVRARMPTADTLSHSSQLSWSPDPTAPDFLLGAGQALCMQSAILDAARERYESRVLSSRSPVTTSSHGSRMTEHIEGLGALALARPVPIRRHSEGPEEFLREQQARMHRSASRENGTWWVGEAEDVASAEPTFAAPLGANIREVQEFRRQANRHQRAPSMPLSMPAQWRSSIIHAKTPLEQAQAQTHAPKPSLVATPVAEANSTSTPRARIFSLKMRRPATASNATSSTSSRFNANVEASPAPAPTRPAHRRSQTAGNASVLLVPSTATAPATPEATTQQQQQQSSKPKGTAKRVVSDGLALLRRARSARRSGSAAP